MATESQLIANRTNAPSRTSVRPYPHDAQTQRSTSGQGPVTAEGKSRVSRNATSSTSVRPYPHDAQTQRSTPGQGLFSATDFVHPDERDIYTEFCAAYEADLSPAGALEQTLAAEILHAGWRLRRCSTLETSGDHAQDSIDRARASAHRIFTRSINELRKLQTERQLRQTSDTPALGLASSKAIAQAAHCAAKAAEAAAEAGLRERVAIMRRKAMEIHERHMPTHFTKQSQSAPPEAVQTPRGAPCSCGSGIKFKRCCGKDAPPMLGRAA